jgi:hypothetical protein
MRTLIFTLIYAVFFTPIVEAQSSTDTAAIPFNGSPTADWTSTIQTVRGWHSKLYVVTVDRPGHRYNCNVQSIDASGITCAPSGLHDARTFAQDKIAALIKPGFHEKIWPAVFGCLAVGDGMIVAGYFLASIVFPPAIALYVVGSLVVLASGAIAIGSGNSDTPDSVFYQRPNSPLTVQLR